MFAFKSQILQTANYFGVKEKYILNKKNKWVFFSLKPLAV